MKLAEQLIGMMELELKNREEVIAELEQDLSYFPKTVRSLAETVTERESEIAQLRAELAALKAQEPVAYIPVDRETGEEWHPVLKKGSGNICDYKPLYAAPVVSAEQQVVADGWKLVPAEPTQEMNNAFHAAISTWLEEIGHDDDVYKAMLAAAPAPSTTEGRGDDACKWTRDEETGSYETQCGKTWHLSDGGYPEEHGQYFCHHCGKKIDEEAEIHE